MKKKMIPPKNEFPYASECVESVQSTDGQKRDLNNLTI